jgi:hypothetical protein
MGNNKKIVKNWRGSRASYNILAKAGRLDYWTRYSVKDTNGVWTEYYGDNQITSPSGQLLPVLDIVATLPSSLNPGDRYLVGKDGSEASPAEYYIVTIYVDNEQPNGINGNTEPFTNNSGMSVRVINQGSMAYQLVDNILLTYDKVDGGCF